jgi:xanthine dehydrogenase YagS FAD-binding subunit
MKNFEYFSPETLEEAKNLTAESAKQVAIQGGGTDLIGLIKSDLVQPDVLIDVKRLKGLDKIVYENGNGFIIGASVKIADIANDNRIKNRIPLLSQAAGEIGSPQLRNMGTLGGNLCQRPRCWYFRGDFPCIRKNGDICYAYLGENKYHCITGGGPCYIIHPSDMAVALLALNAEIKIFSEGKSERMNLKDFFLLPEDDYLRENILKEGDILTEVMIPPQENDIYSKYIKIKEREVWDFAIVSVALVVRKEGNRILKGRIAWGGVAPVPWTDETANSLLTGLELTESKVDSFVSRLFEDNELLEKNAFKLDLVRNLTKMVLLENV